MIRKDELKHVTGILEKSEITVYDVGTILGYVAKAFQAIPESVLRSAEQANEDAQAIVAAAEKAIAWQTEFQSRLEIAEQSLLKRFDDLYKNVIKKRSEIIKDLKDLEPLPEIKVPWGIKELVELAERFSHLTEDQWSAVQELAESLNTKRG